MSKPKEVEYIIVRRTPISDTISVHRTDEPTVVVHARAFDAKAPEPDFHKVYQATERDIVWPVPDSEEDRVPKTIRLDSRNYDWQSFGEGGNGGLNTAVDQLEAYLSDPKEGERRIEVLSKVRDGYGVQHNMPADEGDKQVVAGVRKHLDNLDGALAGFTYPTAKTKTTYIGMQPAKAPTNFVLRDNILTVARVRAQQKHINRKRAGR